MSESTVEAGTVTNRYVTVRTLGDHFFVNTISFDGHEVGFGSHVYRHKRSARRAAKALAKRLDLVYGQDYEYTDYEAPHSVLASK